MIQANVIQGGDSGFDALLYPDVGYLDMSSFSNRLDDVKNRIVGVSESFLNKTKTVYDNINNSETLTIARNALNSARGILRPDVIYRASEDNVFNSTGLMSRYIMAEPTIRGLYQNNKCDGFSNSYIDMYPETLKEEHIDYCRVMDGVMVYPKNNDEWEINYYSNTMDEEPELTIQNQFDILDTWDVVSNLIAEGIDPTDENENSPL